MYHQHLFVNLLSMFSFLSLCQSKNYTNKFLDCSTTSIVCGSYNFIMRNLLLLLLLLMSIAALQTTGNMFLDCSSTSYSCGAQNYLISYPFRKPGMPNHCGHPKFEVQCTQNKSFLSIEINKIQFQIKNIDYDLRILRLSYPYTHEIISSSHLTNITIDSTILTFTASDRVLTVYYDCSLPYNSSYVACLFRDNEDISCFSSDNQFPVHTDGIFQFCKASQIFVLETVVEDLLKEAIALLKALEQGFDLSWTAGEGWCDECRLSNGVCGNNPELANSTACFCPDGNTTLKTCETRRTSMPVEKKRSWAAVIEVVAGVGGVFLLGMCVVLFLCVRRKRNLLSSKMDPETEETYYNAHIFSYDELEEATHGFHESRKLGNGGFGTVYKGKLRDGRTVAVKRLYENKCRFEQFMNEVEILSCVRHQNLVTLYGCTSRHSREFLLVYEYIPNGTLADHLHGSLTSKPALPWPTRMSIIIQIAEALTYLHSVEPQIIHRDIKTNNILVDNNFQVKVADFGISRLFPLDATHVSTAPQGTFGYLDPAYYRSFRLTDKSDVYSFGVVLIELISSKPAVDITRHSDEISLANMAIAKIQKCRVGELVEPDLGYGSDLEITEMIDQVARLAFRCLLSNAEMRPGLKEVLRVLKRIKGEVDADGVGSSVKEECKLLSNAVLFSSDYVTGR